MHRVHYEHVTEHESDIWLNARNVPDALQMFVDVSAHNEKITEI